MVVLVSSRRGVVVVVIIIFSVIVHFDCRVCGSACLSACFISIVASLYFGRRDVVFVCETFHQQMGAIIAVVIAIN